MDYLDNTDANREKRQEGDIVFTAATDRAYFNTTHPVEILDPALRRRIRLEKENSLTHRGVESVDRRRESMADLGDDEWREMACVEASNMRVFAVDLAPGQQHIMKTSIRVTAATGDRFKRPRHGAGQVRSRASIRGASQRRLENM